MFYKSMSFSSAIMGMPHNIYTSHNWVTAKHLNPLHAKDFPQHPIWNAYKPGQMETRPKECNHNHHLSESKNNIFERELSRKEKHRRALKHVCLTSVIALINGVCKVSEDVPQRVMEAGLVLQLFSKSLG